MDAFLDAVPAWVWWLLLSPLVLLLLIRFFIAVLIGFTPFYREEQEDGYEDPTTGSVPADWSGYSRA